jgi:cellulose synthase/poly-beta-1,6-N-acetylglucosamine synthase-like glycosyltransferase
MNFVFGVKNKHNGKMSSHKWFFDSVCELLEPLTFLYLDIGTRPDKRSLVDLYKYMICHPKCGGVCGEIEVSMAEK